MSSTMDTVNTVLIGILTIQDVETQTSPQLIWLQWIEPHLNLNIESMINQKMNSKKFMWIKLILLSNGQVIQLKSKLMIFREQVLSNPLWENRFLELILIMKPIMLFFMLVLSIPSMVREKILKCNLFICLQLLLQILQKPKHSRWLEWAFCSLTQVQPLILLRLKFKL